MNITDHHISLFQSHKSSVWASCCAADQVVETIRLSGVRMAEDRLHVELFVPELFARQFLAQVRANPMMSFLASSIYTYEAFQLKGEFLGHRPSTPEEQQFQKAYMEGFAGELVKVGIQAGPYFARYYREPSLVIRMRADELFEQTPKVGTGKKLA